MRVGSASEIHQLFMPRTKSKDASGTPEEQASSIPRVSGGTPVNDEVVAAFLAKLAESNFNRDDTNGDGIVSRQEYIDDKMERRPNGYQPQIEDVQKTWNELDKDGKGQLNEQEYTQAFGSVFRVTRGTIEKPIG
ncbi:EF-hand domain-containing protein [Neorhizobium sp. CSC1952]|uniref:EF-hand domain-containing protein n=1 Tax=Neorhizobium sp. CSC1952 TaxID=2978974 RepID=UPI0025A649E4|nr:EF-hand domain-containing protein [Rhizobium sp. CSC1952]WJR66335.1 EF-hand domain-containing protein [Rhizobium sp. CSC1952]